MGRKALSKGKEVAVPDMGTTPAAAAADESLARQHLQFADAFLPAATGYDRDAMIEKCQRHLGHAAAEWLEFGKTALIIKEHEPHGDFATICDDSFRLSYRAVRQAMQAAVRYLGPDGGPKWQAPAILGPTKLVELFVLDDEEMDALDEGGTVRGLTLDKIARMSSRQVREALRTAQSDMEAKDARAEKRERELERKTAEIARLKRQSAKADPDELTKSLRIELGAEAISIEAAIGADGKDVTSLRTRVRALIEHGETTGEDHGVYLAGVFAQIERTLHMVREDFLIERNAIGDPAEEARARLGDEG